MSSAKTSQPVPNVPSPPGEVPGWGPRVWLIAILALLSSCGPDPKPKTNWSVTLDGGKNPYGAYLARQSLKDYFPSASIEDLNRRYRYTSMDEHMLSNGGQMMVMLGLDFRLNNDEWDNLRRFASNGNEVVIFCSGPDHLLEQDLRISFNGGNEEEPLSENNSGDDNRRILMLSGDRTRYGYKGRDLGGSMHSDVLDSMELRNKAGDTIGIAGSTPVVLNIDSLIAEEEDEDNDYSSDASDDYGQDRSFDVDATPDVIGTRTPIGASISAAPDAMRFSVGRGHITLHAAPLAVSNYFLLQPGNREYLDRFWGTFPANVYTIYWHEYYKRTADKSEMSVLLRYPATRWAIIIAGLTILLYVIFESRRKQRIIPEIPPLQNASVSFVETVGHLYYARGNHANLAHKMILHFLEWIRLKYGMDTTQLNADFARAFAARSGNNEARVHDVLHAINQARSQGMAVSDAQLSHLYFLLQSFYQNDSSKKV